MRKCLLFSCMILLMYSCKKDNSVNPEVLPNGYSNQALGKSAMDILSASTYSSMTIEVQYMPGYMLDASTIANLTIFLDSICNKPGGIVINQTQIAANGNTFTVDSAAITERKNRTAYTAGHNVAIYILVTDGFDTSLTTLGFAYRNTSICLFGKDIFTNSGGFGQVSRVALETSVLEHELCHIMGLVNLGSPMVVAHEDAAHLNHCINPRCLMYYAINTNRALPGMAGNVPVMDSSCRRDLRANGGK